jgi:predicted amino acid racemase
MTRVIIDLDALQHNIDVVDKWLTEHGATWTLVTKAMCGNREVLRALQRLGVRSMADSRLENLRAVERLRDDLETWYLRPPHLGEIEEVVELANVSLNSESETIAALDREAARHGCIHRVVVMFELGDLREGILPGSLLDFFERVFRLSNIEVLGLGANLGCLSGVVPSVEQLSHLSLYRELIQLKFGRQLRLISAGASSVLPLLREGRVPEDVDHFRIGEGVFLGTDLVYGGTLEGLREDTVTVEAEIIEIKEKSLLPVGETSDVSPFSAIGDQTSQEPGQRGYRALVNLGQVDTHVAGLRPIDPTHEIAGASSDITVVNVGPDPQGLRLGGTIRFRPDYAALVRLMAVQYVHKQVTPPLEDLEAPPTHEPAALTPVLADDELGHPRTTS